jgi:transcriptional regulator with XRE-family HTH domain
MPDFVVPLGSGSLAVRLGELVRDARVLVGWSQAELARRCDSSQASISRIEHGLADVLDVLVVERILDALGMHAALQVEGRHLGDRRRQREPVHARMNGFVAGQLARRGFLPALEVEVGAGPVRGWIDLLAYRPADRALIVEETKGDLPDVGAFQRSLAFYAREARAAANRLGWKPTRVVVLAAMLDSVAMGRRLLDNRELLTRAFPSPVDRLLAWIDDPSAPAPFAWTLAMCDPATRSAAWLRPTVLGPRRRPAAYADYADAAARLTPGRRVRHGSRPPRRSSSG